MEITATELKLNLGKYLEAANDEVIEITKNGKTIAKLIGTRTFKYDLSELDILKRMVDGGLVVSEQQTPAYGTSCSKPPGDFWALTLNGEPIAQLTPLLKEKPRRKLGLYEGPPSSDETNAALFESDYTDEDYERWLNEKW